MHNEIMFLVLPHVLIVLCITAVIVRYYARLGVLEKFGSERAIGHNW